MMTDCIFCKIVNGEIKSDKIYEDEKFLAFLDANPMHPAHTLLIPKKHTDYLFDLNDEEYVELMLKAKEIAKKLKLAMNTEKIGLVVEGFLVRHIHIHLIPINQGMSLDPKLQKPMDENQKEIIIRKITEVFEK
jgi:histidine triad (HIT) family protein